MKEVKVPELVESIVEGTISAWLKNEGDVVAVGDAIMELETDKITVEVLAEANGVLSNIKNHDGDNVKVGQVIAYIDESKTAESAPAKEEVKEVEVEKPAKVEAQKTVPVQELNPNIEGTPAQRRAIREGGVLVEAPKPAAPKQPVVEQVATDFNKPVHIEKMSRRRQTIANRLVEAQRTMAILTTFNEVDMTEVMALRKEVQDSFVKNHNVKLGLMSFFTKAVVGALKKYPKLNAEIRGDEIVYKKYYDIGIAVSAEDGLVVPVLRNADRLNFPETEKGIAELSSKARERRLGLSDLQDATFTITNGGVFGSLWSTPIINMPQVGILGMHTIQNRQVVLKDGTVAIRPMMYIALSYDHRIIDGSESVTFLKTIKEMIEDPKKLFLEG